MKRVFAILAGLTVLFPGVCGASGYFLANYGLGGESDGASLGVEIGAVFLSSLHPSGGAFSIGVGVSGADTDENPPSAPSTVLPLTRLRDYNDGYEQEITAVFGAELVPALFAVGGLGYASQDIETFGLNGGTLYEKGSDTENWATYMLGLRYVIEGLNVGVGYHTRRGVMAGIGIAF
jgi:hypothetical protein